MVVWKIIIFLFLLLGFTGIFYQFKKSNVLKRKVKEAYETMDKASLQNAREHRNRLLQLDKEESIFDKISNRFTYSGLGKRFTFLNKELWILIQLIMAVGIYFITVLIYQKWMIALITAIIFLFVLYGLESLLILKNYKSVDDNLLEFLNILGNYSITSGDISGVLHKVSKYMNEPLKSALEECYYETQTTGDNTLALHSLAEKIEHPKFKEIIRSLEVCSRYSADFSVLVKSNRKMLQDYMSAKKDRSSLAREAKTNMLILIGMLIVILALTDQMLNVSIWSVLFHTTIGKIAVLIILCILVIFYYQTAITEK